MTFKLTPDATFPFSAQIPNGSAPLTLKLIGKRKGKEALADFIRAAGGQADIDLLDDALAGWEDVDADYSREALGTLLANYAGAALPIYVAYIKAHTEAERKN